MQENSSDDEHMYQQFESGLLPTQPTTVGVSQTEEAADTGKLLHRGYASAWKEQAEATRACTLKCWGYERNANTAKPAEPL